VRTIRNILVIASALAVSYAVITYGAWYWATCWQWEDRLGQNGCLLLKYVSPKSIEGEVFSPKTGKVRTKISDGFPVLLSIGRAKFRIPEQQGVDGVMSLSLSVGLNEIKIHQTYSRGPARLDAPPIRFSRVSKCASKRSQ
jgi:hypothetical protein